MKKGKTSDNSNYLTKNNIYNTDCSALIKQLKKQKIKVDLILTDPPYNISKKNNFKTIGRSGIDFGEWDKGFNQLAWLDNIADVLSDNGSILIFNDWKNMGDIARKLEQEGFDVKDLIRWIKPNPMPRNVERRYVTDFEFIIWATKKKAKWTFNKINEPYLKPEYFSSAPGNSRIHPTEKPEKLIAELIEVHSNKGDLILDLFSGSGAISCTADKLDRYYIACEKDKKYYDASIKRIKNNYGRPAFNHLGNKTRILQELIGHFPKKEVNDFIEPFAGSGIVSITYQSAKKYWLNDNDENLSRVLEYLLNNEKELVISNIEGIIKKYKLPIEKSKNYTKEYNKLKNDFNKDKKIGKLLVLILFGFNQQIRFNSKGEFNIPVGKFFWSDYHKEKIINFIDKKNNKNFETKSLDFESFINDVKKQVDQKKSFFYFDPPYFLSNATYNSNWHDEDEKRLISCLQDLTNNGYKWCLSNVVKSKGKKNNYLLNFIEANNGKVKWKTLNDVNYHNSNYQRKSKTNEDIEILVWGNYE